MLKMSFFFFFPSLSIYIYIFYFYSISILFIITLAWIRVTTQEILKGISNSMPPRSLIALVLLTVGTALTFVIEVIDVLRTWHSHHFARHTFWPADNTIPLRKTKAICVRDTNMNSSHHFERITHVGNTVIQG